MLKYTNLSLHHADRRNDRTATTRESMTSDESSAAASTSTPTGCYVIGHITVRDSASWDEYRRQVPATLPPWKGETVMRGYCTDVLSGEHAHEATVVLRFPDRQSALAWHASAAYQSIVPLRRQAADVVLIVTEST